MNKNPLDTGHTNIRYGPGPISVPASGLTPVMNTPATSSSDSGFGGFIHSIGSGLDDMGKLESRALTGIAGIYGLKKGMGALGGLAGRLMPQAFQDILVPLEEAGIEMAPLAIAALA